MSTAQGSDPTSRCEDAATAYIRRIAPRVLRTAVCYTEDPVLAQDIAQEVLAKIYFKIWPDDVKRAKLLDRPGYLSRVILNCFLDHCRAPKSRSNRTEVALDPAQGYAAAPEMDHELSMAIRELPDDERAMIELLIQLDFNCRTAGELLGLSGTQPYRLRDRAYRSLAKLLHDHEEEV
ncbi:RNA polymerase sigma factor [Nonomuraea typhae]|uniref:RNA polymerase sigma factor n=1 Tax=Nonomuraea typhae TaxID=2603600 RepID=A0ABW7Z8B9_9ACTN